MQIPHGASLWAEYRYNETYEPRTDIPATRLQMRDKKIRQFLMQRKTACNRRWNVKNGSYLVALACLFAVVGCSRSVDLEKSKQEVGAVLDQYVQSVVREDMEEYAKHVFHDPEMVNFGAFGAPIAGWDALRGVMEGQNAGIDSIGIDQSMVQIHVLPGGMNAWATSLWRFTAKAGQNALDLPVRCTWVLEKRGGAWLVVHFHKSIAAG